MARPKAVPGRPRRKAHVALFEATTLTAKGVKEQLVSRSFPIASVHLYTSSDDPESNLTEFGGEAMLVTAPDIDLLGSLDIAFLCGSRQDGARYLDWAGRKGFVAIDLSRAAEGATNIPLVNAAVNPEAIPDPARVIATPHPIAQFLSSLLAPIRRRCDLVSASAVVFQPASACGDPGIEELYRQTTGLLNFQDIPREVFGRQLAFNLIPAASYGSAQAPGGADLESLRHETLRVTGGSYALALEVVLAPVFHCHAAAVHVTLPDGAGLESLRAAFDPGEEVRVAGPEDAVSPAESAGKAGVLVAGLRQAGDRSGFWLWALTDDLKSGAARNAVRIAETILERGMPRSAA